MSSTPDYHPWPKKGTPIDKLRINFDADEATRWLQPGGAIYCLKTKQGKGFNDITFEDLESYLSGWPFFNEAKVISLFDSAGQERILIERTEVESVPTESTQSETTPPEYFYYLALAAHPGKMFRIRCEEVGGGFGLAAQIVPANEGFNKQYRTFTGETSKPLAAPIPIGVSPPKVTLTKIQKLKAWIKSLLKR